ncbi:hypothetical protein CAEBREN_03936 [Caenorhabditis brenneri]|uniref:non-specific serine/threonine protein kinase n=1 Tax=Caenorhabditis brenneri TaxID=135651 RepID=G0N4G1_CAEBE|nr:hypothetical protein CAEBREN_03936 [Caenorhabditis brenneri]
MVQTGVLLEENLKLEEQIGKGSYGVVFRAVDESIQNVFAVKFLKQKRSSGDSDSEFETEVNALRALGHTEIVPILHRTGSFEDYNYLVFEYLDENLHKLRKRNAGRVFKVSTMLTLLWNIVKCLETIHQAGIVHRDLKLDNVMIKVKENTCKVVIIDFGLSEFFRNRSDRPQNEVVHSSRPLAPPGAARGIPYFETDDLITASYAAVHMRGYIPWFKKGEYNPNMLDQKIQFGHNPEFYLRPDDMCLAPIIREIHSQVYGQTPNYDHIMDTIREALDKYNATTDVIVNFVNGQLRLE